MVRKYKLQWLVGWWHQSYYASSDPSCLLSGAAPVAEDEEFLPFVPSVWLLLVDPNEEFCSPPILVNLLTLSKKFVATDKRVQVHELPFLSPTIPVPSVLILRENCCGRSNSIFGTSEIFPTICETPRPALIEFRMESVEPAYPSSRLTGTKTARFTIGQ